MLQIDAYFPFEFGDESVLIFTALVFLSDEKCPQVIDRQEGFSSFKMRVGASLTPQQGCYLLLRISVAGSQKM